MIPEKQQYELAGDVKIRVKGNDETINLQDIQVKTSYGSRKYYYVKDGTKHYLKISANDMIDGVLKNIKEKKSTPEQLHRYKQMSILIHKFVDDNEVGQKGTFKEGSLKVTNYLVHKIRSFFGNMLEQREMKLGAMDAQILALEIKATNNIQEAKEKFKEFNTILEKYPDSKKSKEVIESIKTSEQWIKEIEDQANQMPK